MWFFPLFSRALNISYRHENWRFCFHRSRRILCPTWKFLIPKGLLIQICCRNDVNINSSPIRSTPQRERECMINWNQIMNKSPLHTFRKANWTEHISLVSSGFPRINALRKMTSHAKQSSVKQESACDSWRFYFGSIMFVGCQCLVEK